MSLLRAFLDNLRLWTIAVLLVTHGVGHSNCRVSLEDLTVTENLIAYLDTLFEQGYVADPNAYVRILIQDIANKKALSSPFKEDLKNSNDIIQADNFNSQVLNPEINRDQLKQWLVQKLNVLEQTAQQKNISKDKVTTAHIEMKFHKINPGKQGKSPRASDYENYEIITPFEVMETVVTQKMWSDVMGFKPANNLGSDHPMTNITWWSAAVFANRLSEMHGLKPVYDFSKVRALEGKAEDGTLKPVFSHDSNYIRINAPFRSIYRAEGFRLPSAAELIMMHYRFDKREDINDALYGREIFDYGWFFENSYDQVHPVAEKLPYIIDGNPFYDLHGNVAHFTHDFEYKSVRRHTPKFHYSSVNPQMNFKKADIPHLAFGSPFDQKHKETFEIPRLTVHGDSDKRLGFRLARTLVKGKTP